jgi:hypothetical protein
LSSIEVIFHKGCLPLLKSKFFSFPDISLLARLGWVGEKLKIKLNSAQLELDLGLSLAK